MIYGLDMYAPATDAQAKRALAHNFLFQGIYFGTGGKVFKPANVAPFQTNGLHVITYFERGSGRVTQGRDAGLEDADLAMEQAAEVGQPAGTPIYFAADEDLNLANIAVANPIFAYYEAIKERLTTWLAGDYGEGDLCAQLFAKGLVTHTVEAGAEGWHGSKAFTGQTVKQYAELKAGSETNLLGWDYDPLECLNLASAGAWLPGSDQLPQAQPSGVPPAVPAPTAADPIISRFLSDFQAAEDFLRRKGLYHGPTDNDPGPGFRAALSVYLRRTSP